MSISPSLGRDAKKAWKCMFKGQETCCPNQCDTCAFPVKLLGDAALRNGDAEMAESFYRKALDIKPDYTDVWNNLGNLLGMTRRFSESLYAFEQALSLDPTYGKAMRGRVTSLKNLMRYDEALQQAAELLTLYADPNTVKEREDILFRMDTTGRIGRKQARQTLKNTLSYANHLGYIPHNTTPWLKEAIEGAEEKVYTLFLRSLHKLLQSGTPIGKRQIRQALEQCLILGFGSEIDKQVAEDIGLFALHDFRHAMGWDALSAEYDEDDEVKIDDYAECAMAVYMLGAIWAAQLQGIY